MNQRRHIVLGMMAMSALLGLAGCGARETEEQRQHDANTVAGKIGQGAHRAALEVNKAGRVIGRQLDKAAHNARAGWNEDARKHRGGQH